MLPARAPNSPAVLTGTSTHCTTSSGLLTSFKGLAHYRQCKVALQSQRDVVVAFTQEETSGAGLLGTLPAHCPCTCTALKHCGTARLCIGCSVGSRGALFAPSSCHCCDEHSCHTLEWHVVCLLRSSRYCQHPLTPALVSPHAESFHIVHARQSAQQSSWWALRILSMISACALPAAEKGHVAHAKLAHVDNHRQSLPRHVLHYGLRVGVAMQTATCVEDNC
jgi:hypothetical protein